MKYCENCMTLCASECCEVCGNLQVREVTSKDFCFLLECEETFGEMLKPILDETNIACELIPAGNGARSAFGLRLGNYRVYVPYQQYETAQEILKDLWDDPADDLREDLLENADRWHVKNDGALKKLRKKLALTEKEDFLAYVKDGVASAAEISDDGLISACTRGGHYISVKIKNQRIWFNSETYEIFI